MVTLYLTYQLIFACKQQAPHTQRMVCNDAWSMPYSRTEAAFPVVSNCSRALKGFKFLLVF